MNLIKLCVIGAALAFSIDAAKADVVLYDRFDYQNGPLVETSEGRWIHHSGGDGEADIEEGALRLTAAESEDVNRELNGGPYPPDNPTIFYAGFTLRMTALPSSSGGYFAHFKTGGNSFRGRLFATLHPDDDSRFAIGVSNRGSAPDAIVETPLSLEQSYPVVLGYEVSTGLTTLWLHAGTDQEISIQALDDPSTIEVAAVAFRQSSGIGDMAIDDLILATSLAEVSGLNADAVNILTQPGDASVMEGDAVRFQVVAAGPGPLSYQWRFNGVDIPNAAQAEFHIESAAFSHAGEYSATVRSGNEEVNSRAARLDVSPIELPVSPPLIGFTASSNGFKRTGDAPESGEFSEYSIRAGETLAIDARISDEFNRQVDLGASNLTPDGFDWEITREAEGAIHAEVLFTPDASHEGQAFQFALSGVNADGESTLQWKVYVPTRREENIVINEILANPSNDEQHPAYNPLARAIPAERARISAEDEYIELINLNGESIDLSNWTLSDAVAVRHVFPPGTVLEAGQSMIVYGGHESGSATTIEAAHQIASENGLVGLALNNGGDRVELRNANGQLVERIVYGSPAENQGSLTRFPDGNGDWADHATVSGLVVSPGLQTDGESFRSTNPDPVTEPEPEPELDPVRVDVRENQGMILLSWEAAPGEPYSLWSSEGLDRSFSKVDGPLVFESELGEYRIPILGRVPCRFYRVSAP